jgi:hypothetical protein
MSRPRALNLPRAARVRSRDGSPCEVNGELVDAVRESWLVEDRWWTEHPLRRRYWELVSVRGRNLVVFHDLTAAGGGAYGTTVGGSGARGGWGSGARGGWFTQGS